MSSRFTDRLLDFHAAGLSRRGFLAKVGGTVAGLGLMLAGADAMPRRVMANHGCCNSHAHCGS